MRRSRSSQGGFSLATTLIIVALVGGIASALIILSTNQMSVDQKTRDKVRATYLAEAGVEHLAHLLRKAHANAMDLTVPTAVAGAPLVVDGIELETSDLWRANALADGSTVLDTTTPATDGEAETISAETTIDDHRIKLTAERFLQKPPLSPDDEGYDPLEAQTTTIMYSLTAELRYIARAENDDEKLASLDDTLRRVHAGVLGRIVRVMEYKITPIFDKFAFWNGDLEILPGPRAIFNGRIHTNENLYIGAGGGLTINTDYIRARGDMFRHRLDNPGGSATNFVEIRDPYKDPYAAQGQLGENAWDWSMKYESADTYNSSWNETDNWLDQIGADTLNGKVRNKANESDQKLNLVPPEIQVKDVDGFYHQNADIVIRDDKVFQRSGSDLVDITSTLPSGTISTSSIYDAREVTNTAHSNNGEPVPVTVIDVGKLQSGAGFPENGVIYAYRSQTAAPTATSQGRIEGIQLTNGASLAGNLTVVTNGPAYVHGDYNVDVPADTGAGTPANPRKGAAIIADAVNLLSNGWDNTKAKGGSLPTAKETTYNFALVTGNVPTDPGKSYSGGLENLPRFHENWSGVNCNYQGALMCLWESKIATGKWGQGGVYVPPTRNWDFDARFGDPDSTAKPPLFPQTVSISRTTYQEGYPVTVVED